MRSSIRFRHLYIRRIVGCSGRRYQGFRQMHIRVLPPITIVGLPIAGEFLRCRRIALPKTTLL